MKVRDLFTISQGNSFELMNMKLSDTSSIGFVSRTAQDNGVIAQVCPDDTIKPFPAGCVTVALGGSVLSAFVQLRPFYTAFHIAVLTPKTDLTLHEKLYYCMCIQANAYRYSYGRQANKTLKDIELPDAIPEWVYGVSLEPVKTAVKRQTVSLSPVQEWGYVRLGDIFAFENCRCGTARDLLSDGSDCFYLGAKKSDNGVMRRVAYDSGELHCLYMRRPGVRRLFKLHGQGLYRLHHPGGRTK